MKKLVSVFVVISSIFILSYSALADLESGLVLYLPLNSDATDESGYNNHGTEYGLISYDTSLIKGTAELNGVDVYIQIPYSSVIAPTNFTLSTWIRTSEKQIKQAIINTNNEDSCHHGYNLIVMEDGRIRFILDKSSNCNTVNNDAYSKAPVNDGEWHHIVATYEGEQSDTLSLYIDGVFQESAINGHAKANRPIRIGKVNNGKKFFNGNIDEVRMYNRILTEGEIKELYEKHITADAGPDQMVYDEIILDGTQSFDPYSEVVTPSLKWQIVHRMYPSLIKTAEGTQPTLSNLKPGFYDAYLTVSDGEGSLHTDHMLFSAIGCKGDFDGDGNVDGTDLTEFAENFGRKDCPCDKGEIIFQPGPEEGMDNYITTIPYDDYGKDDEELIIERYGEELYVIDYNSSSDNERKLLT